MIIDLSPIGNESLHVIPWVFDLDQSPRFVESLIRYRVHGKQITVRDIIPQLGWNEPNDKRIWLVFPKSVLSLIEIERLLSRQSFQAGVLEGAIETEIRNRAESDREQVANLANERTN